MSGGHFNYSQYHCSGIADEIENYIECMDDEEREYYGEEIIERFRLTAKYLRKAGAMAQRVDWLISGDDGPESFIKRWKNQNLPED